ncbi:MAG: ABC transporter ATP-binding protein [Beijerinckiaceae bacterium]
MSASPAASAHAAQQARMREAPLFAVADLRKHFPLAKTKLIGGERPIVRAVDGLTFDVYAGETLGIVGESGCGKSTTARLLVDLISRDSGTITLDGKSVGDEIPPREFRRRVQMVFQDSFASLNPRMIIRDIIAFGPKVHGVSESDAETIAYDLLNHVGLDPSRFAGRYPHELSGGQRQRVNIARALALKPQVVVLDEPVSALDKSVEAQVLNLLGDLKAEFGLTYLFISHDLNVVRYISDRVMVMYLGQVVEIGPVDQVYDHPAHPYTRALLSAMPSMDPDHRTESAPLAGDPPNPINPPSGCRFHTRCAFAEDVCRTKMPALLVRENAQHMAACHIGISGSGHSQARAIA